MTGKKSNLPASVAARLLNRAKQTGDTYQTLLTSFCFERFLSTPRSDRCLGGLQMKASGMCGSDLKFYRSPPGA